jgi:putative peptidoglycan lipid II flippase
MMLGLTLGALAGMNILITFAYQWYVLTTVGPGPATDALFAGTMVPQLVLVLMTSSLSYVLVPLLAVEEGEARHRLGWTYLQGIGALSLAIVSLLMVTATVWVPLTVPGFSPDVMRLAVHLTRLQLFGAVFTAMTGVEVALHYARHRFVRAEASAVVGGVSAVAFVVWGLPRMGIEAAAWGTIVRAGLQMAVLLPGMGRYCAPAWGDPTLRIALRRSAPLLAGQLYYKSDGLLDRFFASQAPAGGLSLYHVSQQLYSSAAMVANRALVSPLVPRLSRLANLSQWSTFVAEVQRRLGLMLLVALAGTAALALVGHPVLALLFGHRQFTIERVEHLWILMLLLSGVWIGGVVGQVLSTSFYAQGDTRTPTLIGVAGFTFAIVLKVAAFRWHGITGLALAASTYYLLNATVLLVCLRRRARRVTQPALPVEELVSP